MSNDSWEAISPSVNSEAEFFEILNDFGNPLEILREAISNSVDAGASFIRITFEVREVEGDKRSVIVLEDDGAGMTKDVLSNAFWGLGYSHSRGIEGKIGEKGHGTKIFFRSEKVAVMTQSKEGAYESVCERPLSALAQRRLHQPKIRPIEPFKKEGAGTKIEIIGYNNNERSAFVRGRVRDYLLWFTKIGSVEGQFGVDKLNDFKTFIKCLGMDDYEEIKFGHVFPEENNNIKELFENRESDAADLYVKKYLWPNQRLLKHPEVRYDAVVYVEGDQAKRNYNPMIRMRARPDTGGYKVVDRYGIWLCKDFIPISPVNQWIIGFGTGGNAYVLLHGFINCQDLKLTANRGAFSNTDPQIVEELKSRVEEHIREIDSDLHDKGIHLLRTWQEEEKTLKQETSEYDRRLKNLKNRKVARYKDRLLVEPQNEAELFGLFATIYCLHPELFDFEPLDYNTTNGIDIIARNKSPNRITEGDHWYVELKYLLKTKFNHAFKHLRWIICWDFDKKVTPESEFSGVEESDVRALEISTDDDGYNIYFLNPRKRATKVQIIKLKEFLKDRLGLEFKQESIKTS